MRFDYISQEAWKEFTERFPRAVTFLTQKSLEGELRILQNHTGNEWERKRLAELKELLAPVETCKRCEGIGRVEDPDPESSYITDDAMMPCPECEGG